MNRFGKRSGKRPGFVQGVIVAAVFGFFTSAIVATLTPFVGFGSVIRLVIPALGLAYLVYLLSRSKERLGRVTTLTLWGMLAVAAIGVFLPCPIAFDIIVASALLTIGVPVAYVMALLITLGTYSIYPMMIMWKSVSPKVALTLLVAVALLGVSTGMIAERIDRAEMQEMMEVFDQEFSQFE